MEGKVMSISQFAIAAIVALGGVLLAFGVNLDVETLKAIVMSAEARALAFVAAVTVFLPSIPTLFATLTSDATLEEKINAGALFLVAVVVLLGAVAAAFGITFDVDALKALVANWQTRALAAAAAISTFLPSIQKLISDLFGGDEPTTARR